MPLSLSTILPNPTQSWTMEEAEKIKTREECSFEEQLHLKSHTWNTTAMIHTLPNELLACIFTMCSTVNIVYAGRSRTVPSVSTVMWVHLRLVCRLWNDIANATPELWRAADIYSDPKLNWLQVCLARSGAVPVDIAFHCGTLPRKQFDVELLLPHSHRIKSLLFDYVKEDWRPILLRMFLDSMQALENLRYVRDTRGIAGVRVTANAYDDLRISLDRFPRLHTLELAGTAAPRDPLVYGRLRSLILEDCSCDLTYKQFLDALSSAQSLRHVRLCDLLRQLRGDLASNHRATLPQLTCLELQAHSPEQSATFLDHVYLPVLNELEVHGEIRAVAESDLTETLRELLPHEPGAYPPFWTRLTEATLRVHENRYTMTLEAHRQTDSPDSRPPHERVKLSIRSRAIHEWIQSFPVGLRDLHDICRGTQLTKLEVWGHHDIVTPEPWILVLRASPKLEFLKICGWGLTTGFWDGLRAASLPPGSDPNADPNVVNAPESEPSTDAVACPGLRTIRLEGYLNVDECLFEAIVESLRVRAERGTRLDEIYLALHHHRFQNYGELKKAFMPRLTEWVRDVRYYWV